VREIAVKSGIALDLREEDPAYRLSNNHSGIRWKHYRSTSVERVLVEM